MRSYKVVKNMQKSIFSFFSGAGLLDLGFENEGYDIVFVNEYNQAFLNAYTYARNNRRDTIRDPLYGCYRGDINDFLVGTENRVLHDRIEEQRNKGNLIGFIGGPPCPDFSVGGKNRGRHGANGILAQSYVDLIVDCHPDFFVFENVKGLVKTEKHRIYYNELKQSLIKNNYLISDAILNALSFGVPQDRDRVILIGVAADLFNLDAYKDKQGNLQFPWLQNALFGNALDIKQRQWRTTQEFVINGRRYYPRSLPDMYRELCVETWFRRNNVENHINGNDVFNVRKGLQKMQTIEEGDVSRKSFKRLHRWRYSPTAAYGNNEVHLHPYKVRRISVAEAMAIQSLPAWFSLPQEMTLTNKFKVIGNGVPFLMARSIARTLSNFLDDIKNDMEEENENRNKRN